MCESASLASPLAYGTGPLPRPAGSLGLLPSGMPTLFRRMAKPSESGEGADLATLLPGSMNLGVSDRFEPGMLLEDQQICHVNAQTS